MNEMQKPGPDLLYVQSHGFRVQMVRRFFGLHLYLAGRCCENPQSARAPGQYKSGPGITWLVDETIYFTFFNNNLPPPRQLLKTKYSKKKLARGMLIKKVIEFQLKGPRSPGHTYTLITG